MMALSAAIRNDLQQTYDQYTVLSETIMDNFKHEQQMITPNDIIRLGRISNFLLDFNDVLSCNRLKAMDLQRLLSRIRYTMENYFRLVNEKNIEGILSRLEVIYDEEFWKFFAYFHAYDRLSDRKLIRLINSNAIKLVTILKVDELVSYYDYPLTIYLQEHMDVLVSIIIHDETSELFLPASLTYEKLEALVTRRLEKATYRQLADFLKLKLSEDVKDNILERFVHNLFQDYRNCLEVFEEDPDNLMWNDLAKFCGYDYDKHIIRMATAYRNYADVESYLEADQRQLISDSVSHHLCEMMDRRLVIFNEWLHDHQISLEQFMSFLINKANKTCHFKVNNIDLTQVSEEKGCGILFRTLTRLMNYEAKQTYYELNYNEEFKVVSYLLFNKESPLARDGETLYTIITEKDMNFYVYDRTQKTYLNFLIVNDYIKKQGIYKPELSVIRMLKTLYDHRSLTVGNPTSEAFRFMMEHELITPSHKLLHNVEEGYIMMILHYLTQRDREGLYDYAVLMHLVMMLLCALYDDNTGDLI